MGLLVMILGLVLFLGAHTLTTQREVRARLIAAIGRGRLQGRLCAGLDWRSCADRRGALRITAPPA